MKLLIVESPGKIKTIQKYLGSDYIVKASVGHIRNLPAKEMGIDILNNFTPLYVTLESRIDTIKDLKKAKKECEEVILATDNDLEGEAIAWHIAEVLKLDVKKTPRIIFQEITKKALNEALSNPSVINMQKVYAQQARQIIDKLCGFSISPLLWKQIRPGLSAGRVQSMAARLTIDRENKIKEFESEGFYKVNGTFSCDCSKKNIDAYLSKDFDEKKNVMDNLELYKESTFTVKSTKQSKSKRNPQPPFITSTLQQEAGKRYGLTAKHTMSIAQKLYEGGHITYHRTDSVNLSKEIIPEVNKYIENNYGEKYINNVNYKTKGKNAQEAHEAIRPTKIELNKKMSAEEKKLYTMIFNRTVASQMAPAEVETTTVKIGISNSKDEFITKAEKIIFPGFTAIYKPLKEEDNEEEECADISIVNILKKLKKNDKLSYKIITATEKFTKPIGRYTEPSLIKKLEDLGIGRPSTYANIIGKIQEREYAIKESRDGKEIDTCILTLKNNDISETIKKRKTENEKNKLFPTDIGTVVDRFLLKNFGHILNYDLTAKVEKELDMIENSKIKWNKVVANFYNELKPTLIELKKGKDDLNTGKRLLGKDKDGSEIFALVAKYGPAILVENKNKKDSKYASLKKDQSIDTITLEEALNLLNYPKNLGDYNSNEIVINIGKFGPYMKYAGSNISIPDEIEIDNITLNDAIKLIKESNTYSNKNIGKYENDDIMLLYGKYGPYLRNNNKNFSIPNTTDISKITLESAIDIIKNKGENIIKKFNEEYKILNGQYGPYLKFKNKNIPIPKNIEINGLKLEDCIELEKNYVKKPFISKFKK